MDSKKPLCTCVVIPAKYEGLGLREARETLKKDLIQRSLAKNQGNVTRAVAELGVGRPTLYELIEKLGTDKMA